MDLTHYTYSMKKIGGMELIFAFSFSFFDENSFHFLKL